MYKFKDTELQYDRRLRDSLSDIYGVGNEKASYVCDLLGLGSSYNINLLNNYLYEVIVIIFKYHYILDDRLRNIKNQRLSFFAECRLRKGLRLKKGLPVRGQRTQTNSQNAYILKPFYDEKEEILVKGKGNKGKGNKGKENKRKENKRKENKGKNKTY